MDVNVFIYDINLNIKTTVLKIFAFQNVISFFNGINQYNSSLLSLTPKNTQ